MANLSAALDQQASMPCGPQSSIIMKLRTSPDLTRSSVRSSNFTDASIFVRSTANTSIYNSAPPPCPPSKLESPQGRNTSYSPWLPQCFARTSESARNNRNGTHEVSEYETSFCLCGRCGTGGFRTAPDVLAMR